MQDWRWDRRTWGSGSTNSGEDRTGGGNIGGSKIGGSKIGGRKTGGGRTRGCKTRKNNSTSGGGGNVVAVELSITELIDHINLLGLGASYCPSTNLRAFQTNHFWREDIVQPKVKYSTPLLSISQHLRSQIWPLLKWGALSNKTGRGSAGRHRATTTRHQDTDQQEDKETNWQGTPILERIPIDSNQKCSLWSGMTA